MIWVKLRRKKKKGNKQKALKAVTYLWSTPKPIPFHSIIQLQTTNFGASTKIGCEDDVRVLPIGYGRHCCFTHREWFIQLQTTRA